MKRNGIIVGIIGLALACSVMSGCGSSSSSSVTGPTGGGDANIVGTYTLTLTASKACSASLPASELKRQYTATITQSGTQVAVNLTGDFALQITSGFVSGNTATIFFDFLETSGFSITADGTGVVNGGTISGTMNGSWDDGLDQNCNAADHLFVFVRK